MASSGILSAVTFICGLAAFLYTVAWVFKNQTSGKLATWTAVVGLAGNTAGILLRWSELSAGITQLRQRMTGDV